MNADDRLALDSLGRVEGGDGVIEGRDVADVRPHSSVTCPPDNLTQLGAIRYDDEVNCQAVSGPRLGRAGDGHQRSSRANHARRPLRDVAAEDIENQIDPADIFQGVVLEVDELLRAEVERRLTATSAAGADDVRADLTCELGRHRTDYAGRTVHEDALPRPKAAVLDQALPRGQARHHEGRALRKVNVARQRREVACLNGYIPRQRAVASPVREAEHPLSYRQPRRSIAEGGDHSGQLVAGDRRRSVTAEAIDPGRGPRQLIPGESRRMNLNNDIAVVRAREAGERRPLRLGPLHQLHPGRSRSLIRHHDRLHRSPPLNQCISEVEPLGSRHSGSVSSLLGGFFGRTRSPTSLASDVATKPVLLIQAEGGCPESAAPRGSNEGAPSAWPRHRRSVRTASAKPDHGPSPPPSCRRSPRCAPAIPRSGRRRLPSPAWVAGTVPRTPPTSSLRPPAHRAVRSLP